jgi:hypothetical protein
VSACDYQDDDNSAAEGEKDSRNVKEEDEGEYSFYGIKSRPAPDVLRDIKRWYVKLERLPGGGEHASSVWQMVYDCP